jgi:hypothetical protein
MTWMTLGTSFASVLLCVSMFFIGAQRIKVDEGQFLELRLPRDSSCRGLPDFALIDSVRITLRGDRRWVGDREVRTDDELAMVIGSRLRGRDVQIGIDALPDEPWANLIHHIDLCKRYGWDEIVFAVPKEERDGWIK